MRVITTLCALLCLLAVAATDAAAASFRTLVIVSSQSFRDTHSAFFASLSDRGHELTFKECDDDLHLKRFGEFLFDNVIFFAPSCEEFGGSLKADALLDFINNGRHVLVGANGNVSDIIRAFGADAGVDFHGDETAVVDHFNYDQSDQGYHTTIAVKAPNHPIIGKTISPVLFEGVGQSINADSPFLTKLLVGAPTTFSANPVGPVQELQNSGANTVLVSALQTRHNARVVFSGSLELFSNKFFGAAVKTNQDKSDLSGNEAFVTEVTKWNFGEKGVVRATNVQHKQVNGNAVNPASYRIKDFIEFSADLSEFDASTNSWKPLTHNDVQLEVVMLDPYIRTTLSHNNKGHYSAQFQLPDVYGVYKFHILHKRWGFSTLEVNQQVSIRPYRHNEFERFLTCAYPYYASVFSMMAGFFIFGIVFLYHKN